MTDYVVAGLLLAGAVLMLLAAIGLLRMPDVFMRMSATSKAAGLGSSLALAAVAVHFDHLEVTTRAVATILFVFLTIPVAAHMVGRAAYLSGVHISSRTRTDELRDRYEPGTFDLAGTDFGAAAATAPANADPAGPKPDEESP